MPIHKDRSPSVSNSGRRRWLQTALTALGAALVPIPASALPHQRASDPFQKEAETAEPRGRFFSPEQYVQVEELAETILPADSRSGGAKAAGVVDYIAQTVGKGVDEERKTLWKEGLRLVDILSEHRYGKRFVLLTPHQRLALLTILSDNEGMSELPEVRFFLDLKELTVRGYYTSAIGIHDELGYKGNQMLREFVGCEEPAAGCSSGCNAVGLSGAPHERRHDR
jgi:hypothetical protein